MSYESGISSTILLLGMGFFDQPHPTRLGRVSGFLGQQKHQHGIALRIRHLDNLRYLYGYIYIYIPRAPMTSIFESQPPKIRPPTKTRVIWIYIYYIPNLHLPHHRCSTSCQSSCATGTKSSSEAERIGRIGKVVERKRC